MNVSVKDDSACRKIMTIEIPADKISEERDETLKAYSKFANIPGFRKGKAPKHVVLKKYAKEIDQDLQERVLPKFYHEALQQSELKVVNVVDATEVQIKDGEPVSFDPVRGGQPHQKLICRGNLEQADPVRALLGRVAEDVNGDLVDGRHAAAGARA